MKWRKLLRFSLSKRFSWLGTAVLMFATAEAVTGHSWGCFWSVTVGSLVVYVSEEICG